MKKILLFFLFAVGVIFWNGCEMPYDVRESEPVWTRGNVLYNTNKMNQSLWDWQVSPDDKKLAYLETHPSFFLSWYDLNSGKQKVLGPVQFDPDYFGITSVFWDEANRRAIIFSSGEFWMFDSSSHQLRNTHVNFQNVNFFQMQNVQLKNDFYHLIGYQSFTFYLFNFHTFHSLEIELQPDTLTPSRNWLKYFVKQNTDTAYAVFAEAIVRFPIQPKPQHPEIIFRKEEITNYYVVDIFQVDENYFGYITRDDSLFLFKFNQSPPLSVYRAFSFPLSDYISTVDKNTLLFWDKYHNKLMLLNFKTGNWITLNYTKTLKNVLKNFETSHFIAESQSLFSFSAIGGQSYLNILNLENNEKIISNKFMEGNPKALCWQNNEKLLLINSRNSEAQQYDFIQTYLMNGATTDSIGVLPASISPEDIQLFPNGVIFLGSSKVYLFDLTGQELGEFTFSYGTFDPATQSYHFLRLRGSNNIEIGTYHPGDSLQTHIYPVNYQAYINGFSVIPSVSPLTLHLGYRYLLSLFDDPPVTKVLKLTNGNFSKFQTVLDNIDKDRKITFQWDASGKNLYYSDEWQIIKLKIWYEF